MTRQSTPEEFDHNGIVYPATIITYFDRQGSEGKSVVMFTYNQVDVNKSFIDGEKYFNSVAKEECELIDKLGAKKYGIFSDNVTRIQKIEKEYIVINQKVFSYFMHTIPHGSKTIYLLSIRMTDGTNIEGGSPLSDIDYRGRESKINVLKNLKSKATYHFKKTSAEPTDDYFEVELTSEYQEKLNWNKKILEK